MGIKNYLRDFLSKIVLIIRIFMFTYYWQASPLQYRSARL